MKEQQVVTGNTENSWIAQDYLRLKIVIWFSLFVIFLIIRGFKKQELVTDLNDVVAIGLATASTVFGCSLIGKCLFSEELREVLKADLTGTMIGGFGQITLSIRSLKEDIIFAVKCLFDYFVKNKRSSSKNKPILRNRQKP